MPWRLKITILASVLFHVGMVSLLLYLSRIDFRQNRLADARGRSHWVESQSWGAGSGGSGGLAPRRKIRLRANPPWRLRSSTKRRPRRSVAAKLKHRSKPRLRPPCRKQSLKPRRKIPPLRNCPSEPFPDQAWATARAKRPDREAAKKKAWAVARAKVADRARDPAVSGLRVAEAKAAAAREIRSWANPVEDSAREALSSGGPAGGT